MDPNWQNDPTITVQGAFTGGGSSAGAQSDHTDHYEFQNYTSLSQGKHFIKFGVRVRAIHDVNTSNAGFNGTFTFSSLPNYESVLNDPTNNTPVQFSISKSASNAGPIVPASMVDTGLYMQDDFKVRPTLTLSYGLRFETQTGIHDHNDWAPRVGFAWGIGGKGKSAPKTVLRGGFGIFYDRFGEDLILNADRQNGIVQQQYVVPDPAGYPAPPTLSQTSQSIYQLNSQVRTPYVMQTAFSLERQVTKIANVTVSYLNSRGVHQLLSINANAPSPGTPYSTLPATLPGHDSSYGSVYQYISEGIFKQNQLIVNYNIRAGSKLSLFGFYALGYANSDVAGASSFPSDQYNIALDYGRAAFDIRHRVLTGGSFSLPHGFRLSPFMIFNSGAPYNVTVGQDLSNDSLFNDRPELAANPTGSCISPIAACHYAVPPSTQTTYNPIPVNYLTGPNHFTLNLRLAKTFGFGRGTNTNTSAQGGPPGGSPPLGGMGGPGGGLRGGGGFGRGGPGGPRRSFRRSGYEPALQPDIQHQRTQRPQQGEPGDSHRNANLTLVRTIEPIGHRSLFQCCRQPQNRTTGNVQFLKLARDAKQNGGIGQRRMPP